MARKKYTRTAPVKKKFWSEQTTTGFKVRFQFPARVSEETFKRVRDLYAANITQGIIKDILTEKNRGV